MKKISTLLLGVAAMTASAQIQFDPEITWNLRAEDSIVLPP